MREKGKHRSERMKIGEGERNREERREGGREGGAISTSSCIPWLQCTLTYLYIISYGIPSLDAC